MPKLLKTPFAVDAAEGFRTDIQESTGAAPNSATYQVGFPPVTMQSIASNGMPPKGSDLNGVLYDITDNLVFLTQGGGYGFDAAYATSIGGYPLNARLRLTNGDIVKSTIDGNANDPNVDMTGWRKPQASEIFDASGKDQQEVNNELYIYKKPVIYAKNLKTDGTDQLLELNTLAAEASTKKLELVLPAGEITVNDEFIPPDGLTISGCTNFSGLTSANSTTIKWGASTGTNKAVIRCSRKAIGVTPSEIESDQISGVVIKGIRIDAFNCDFGFYARNFTNESHAEILAQRAKKCGIWIGQCWFSTFGRLIATFNYGRGIVIGVPLAGETGDTDVNAIEFPYLRAHTNGRDLTFNQTTNIKGGCGIEIRSRGCFYGQIQSEKNKGVGFIENSDWRQNQYSSIYLEENCLDVATTERYGMINYGTTTMLESFTMSRGQVLKNAASQPMYIKNFSCDTASDRAFSTTNVGKIALTGQIYGAFFGLSLAEYRSTFVLYNHKLMSVFANFKYSGTYTTQMFTTQQSIGYPHLVFTPTDTTIPAKSMIFQVDGVQVVINTTGAVKGTPIMVRLVLMSAGLHTVQLMDAAGSADCNGFLEIVYSRLPNGQVGERLGT